MPCYSGDEDMPACMDDFLSVKFDKGKGHRRDEIHIYLKDIKIFTFVIQDDCIAKQTHHFDSDKKDIIFKLGFGGLIRCVVDSCGKSEFVMDYAGTSPMILSSVLMVADLT